MLCDRPEIRRVITGLLLGVLAALSAIGGAPAMAQSACTLGGAGQNAERQFSARAGGYTGVANVCDNGTRPFRTGLRQDVVQQPDATRNQTTVPTAPRTGWIPNLGAN